MTSPSPNPPVAPANTPMEHDEVNAIQPHYDDLLEVLPSATANRALGDPTFVPPNSPDFGSENLSNTIVGIEEMSLGSSRVRDEKAYTLNNTVQDGEANQHIENETEDVSNGIVREVAAPTGSEMALDEPISPGMSVHLRLRARDIEHLSNSVLTLASALESLTRALNTLLQSQEMRAREEEESEAGRARVEENVTTDGEEDTGVDNGEHDGNGNSENNGGQHVA